jgi:hypothetical protein
LCKLPNRLFAQQGPPLHLAIVGAPGTGKLVLAQALLNEIGNTNGHLKVTTVDCPSLFDTICNVDLALLIGPDRCDVSNNTVNQQLRTALAVSNLPFAVIYGDNQARKLSALDAIAHRLKRPIPRSTHETDWKWSCETCADGQCEHKLFTQLL